MANYLYAVRPSSNVVKDRDYHIMTLNGKNLYNNETADDYKAQGLIILSDDEFTTLWEKCQAEYEAEICGHWEEITAEHYNDQLNVLPPLKWASGGFFMPEFYSGSISGFYQRLDGKYYTSLQDVYRPRAEILDDLQAAIQAGTSKKEAM